MSWVDSISPRRSGGPVNIEALRCLLPVLQLIDEAAGRPPTTLAELIDRQTHRTEEGEKELQKLISKARREVAEQEAALMVDWHNPPSDWQPGDIPDLPSAAPPAPVETTPPVETATPKRERRKPHGIQRPRSRTYSYLEWDDD